METPIVEKRKEISDFTRSVIYDRDGEQCRVCGSTDMLSIHHIVPRSRHRNHDYCNLILVCGMCHHYAEAGKLPFNVHSERDLYHLIPVKAFIHQFNYKEIICKIHSLPIGESLEKEPIAHYKYKDQEIVF